MSEVVALLDPPSAESMGAVPVVVRAGDGALTVFGLSTLPARPISKDQLDDLVESRQAMRVAPVSVDLSFEKNQVAMWMGESFLANSLDLGVPAPPELSDHAIRAPQGHAIVGYSEEIYARLEAWLDRAFRKVVAETNAPLARLMTQVLPHHKLTQAALWYSAPSDKVRSDELEWSWRLQRDARIAGGKRELQREFQRLCKGSRWTKVKGVFLVSGPTGSRHGDAAQQIAKLVGTGAGETAMVSFGDYLRDRWKERHHGQAATKPELQQFGQRLVDEGPFRFARMVLTQSSINPDFLIVDGIKHQVIKDAIEFIVDKPTKHLGVDAPELLLMKNLEDEGGGAYVSRVRTAETERALQALMVSVPDRIRYDESARLRNGELEKASDWALERLASVG